MNVVKSRIIIALAKAWGAKCAGMVEASERDVLRQEGARDALRQAMKHVGDLGLHVDKDLKEGVLSASDLKDPVKVEKFIKRFIKRAVGAIDSLATTAEVHRLKATGRMDGVSGVESILRKAAESEVLKLEELEKQIESGEVTLEDVQRGGHPGPSLKHRRLEEKARREAEQSTQSESAPKESASDNVEVTSESSSDVVKSVDSVVSEGGSGKVVDVKKSVSGSQKKPPAKGLPKRPRKKPVPKKK